jgi:flagellar assembly protein FliH
VGVGAKKSLPSCGAEHNEMPEKDIKLHYFPDIPVDESGSTQRCESKENSFKRVHLGQIDSSCSDGYQLAKEDSISILPSELKEIEHQAYQKGFTEGEKTGIESCAQQIEPVLEGLHQALVQVQNLRQKMYHAIEKEVVELALAIARKVVCQEVATNKDLVVCVAKEALSKVKVPGQITLKLNPSDLQVINDTKSHLEHLKNHIDKINFESEETIPSGGCVIETTMGKIDARLEKQFEVLEEVFQTELQKSAQSHAETA